MDGARTFSDEWRCGSCRALLGVQRGRAIHVRYKDAEYLVTGSVVAICRRCGARSTARSDADALIAGHPARAGPAAATRT